MHIAVSKSLKPPFISSSFQSFWAYLVIFIKQYSSGFLKVFLGFGFDCSLVFLDIGYYLLSFSLVPISKHFFVCLFATLTYEWIKKHLSRAMNQLKKLSLDTLFLAACFKSHIYIKLILQAMFSVCRRPKYIIKNYDLNNFSISFCSIQL